MKVLFLLNGLTHYFNSVLNRINAVEGFEVVVIIPHSINDSIGKGVYLTQKGIEFKVYHLKEEKRFYGKVFFKGFKEILKSEKPDVVVFIWPYILELVFNPILLLKIKNKKIKILFKEIPFQLQSFSDAIHFRKYFMLDENLTQVKDSIFKRFNYFFLALIRRIYYSIIDMNLHYIENGFEILKSYKVPKEKIFVTYNSPDTEKLIIANNDSLLFDPILPENKFRLIHVGRLVKWKRVDFIIQTIARLQKQFDSIELVVIGDGPELKNLKRFAEELNVATRIIFAGAIYDPVMLGKYYNCSQIYVLGGMGGLSLNEAMTFGKPIICSVCDGTEKALVKEGYNGLYFVNGELNSLIEKVEFLLSRPDLIKQFGSNSLEIIKNKINKDTVALNYVEAFKSVKKDKLLI